MKTIMIVDDSATMLMSIQGILSKAGHKVETAASGEEAIEKLKGGVIPDLVITDFNMPGMNGIELIRQAKALPGFRFKPMLMLTTESQQSIRDEAKAAGAMGWLVKPIQPPELLGVISQVLPGA